VVVHNNGPDAVPFAALLVDRFASPRPHLDTTQSPTGCIDPGVTNSVTCPVGALQPGESRTLRLTFDQDTAGEPVPGQQISMAVHVGAGIADPDTTNDAVFIQVPVTI
jgi:hypothetical protein